MGNSPNETDTTITCRNCRYRMQHTDTTKEVPITKKTLENENRFPLGKDISDYKGWWQPPCNGEDCQMPFPSFTSLAVHPAVIQTDSTDTSVPFRQDRCGCDRCQFWLAPHPGWLIHCFSQALTSVNRDMTFHGTSPI